MLEYETVDPLSLWWLLGEDGFDAEYEIRRARTHGLFHEYRTCNEGGWDLNFEFGHDAALWIAWYQRRCGIQAWVSRSELQSERQVQPGVERDQELDGESTPSATSEQEFLLEAQQAEAEALRRAEAHRVKLCRAPRGDSPIEAWRGTRALVDLFRMLTIALPPMSPRILTWAMTTRMPRHTMQYFKGYKLYCNG